KVGNTYTFSNAVYNPYCSSTSGSVTIGNAATSSLYGYTPHTCNGNANFWYFMNAWFAVTKYRPTLAKDNDGTIYAIESSVKIPITGKGLVAWGLTGLSTPAMTSGQRSLPTSGLINQLALAGDGT